MNNETRAAIRKLAIKNGVSTAGWSDADFAKYGADNGVTTEPAAPKAPEQAATPVPTPTPSGSVEEAIRALVAASAPQTAAIDEAAVIALIEKHSLAPRTTTITIKRPSAEPVTIEGCHREFSKVMRLIAAGVNVVAVGPAGSGKSTIFEQAAEALEIDYYFQGAVQQEHKIMGYMDANGVYIRTQFRDAYEHGGLFVFEEFDGSAARALLAINNAVAGNWCDFPDGKVKRHENFICVMAGNTFGTGANRQYVGRQQLDAATLDRFAFVEIGYDEALERRAALAFCDGAGPWVDMVQSFRAKVEAQQIRHVVSPRASIMGAKLLAAGCDISDCVETLLLKGLDTDTRAQLGVAA